MSKISRNALLAPLLNFLNLVRILHHFTESCITNCKLCYHLRITSIFLAKNITSQSHSTSAWDFFTLGVFTISRNVALLFEQEFEDVYSILKLKKKQMLMWRVAKISTTHLLCIQGAKGRLFKWNTVHYKSECFQYTK